MVLLLLIIYVQELDMTLWIRDKRIVGLSLVMMVQTMAWGLLSTGPYLVTSSRVRLGVLECDKIVVARGRFLDRILGLWIIVLVC